MSAINVDPKVYELLEVVHETVDPLGVEYAIGGALAMAAAGYARHTKDVDLFVVEKDRFKVLRALRRAGLDVISVFEPHHYAAYLPGHHDDLEVRIDVMVPADEPDLSAIEYPERKALTKGGHEFNVVIPDLLAVMKYHSDREKDEDDFRAMYRHATFDPEQVRAIVVYLAGEEDADEAGREWDKLIASFQRRKMTSRPKAKCKYTPPGR